MSKRKLLLADDSETVQKVVNLTFELEGIEVITFSDGDSAFEQFSAVAPDVVLADVNMPGMSGYDICQNIKGNESTKNTPVILLVGSFEPFDEAKAMQVGADDYLTKPFQSIRQLVSKVNALLAGDADAEPELTFEEKSETAENFSTDYELGDAGMDDEMIQTSHVGSVPADETAKYQTVVSNHEETEEIGKTQPLNRQDWQDIYSAEKNPQTTEKTVYELADDDDNEQIDRPPVSEADTSRHFAGDNLETIAEEKGFEFVETPLMDDGKHELSDTQNPDNAPNENISEDDFGVQPDDIDHFYQEPDYGQTESPDIPEYSDQREPEPVVQQSQSFEEWTDNAEPSPVLPNAGDESDNQTATQQTEPENVIDQNESVSSFYLEPQEKESAPQNYSSVPVLDFDDFDLLEITLPEKTSPTKTVSPPVQTENEPTQTETETVQSVSVPTTETPGVDADEVPIAAESNNKEMPTAELPGYTEPAEQDKFTADDSTEVRNEVADQLSGINLSAEDIDAIAEKVVEKLTARMKE